MIYSIDPAVGLFPQDKPATTPDELKTRLNTPVWEILTTFPFNPLRDLVVCSGSVVEGLGNALSDIDVFVVRDDPQNSRPDEQSGDEGGTIWSDSLNRFIDVTYLSMSSVINVIQRVERNRGKVPTRWEMHPGVALTDLDLYHRLLTSVTLTNNGRALPHLSKAVLQRELAFVHIIPCRARWVDCMGSAISGHHGQALCFALDMLNHAVAAYCSVLGQTNPSDKWRTAVVGRLENDPLELRQWLATMGAGSFDARQWSALISEHAALMLFQVMTFLIDGGFMTMSARPRPGLRFERTLECIYEVDPRGRAARVAEIGRDHRTLQ